MQPDQVQNIIPPLKVFGDKLISNDDIFYWQDLPESLAVFGAGVIGLELGQALSRLGVRVTLFGKGNTIGPLSDPEVLNSSINIFKNSFEFYPDADVIDTEIADNKAVIKFKDNNKTKEASYDYVLSATGRSPNLKNLGLENTGLKPRP